MDTSTLAESLRGLAIEDYNWTLAMYRTKKSDGELDLDIYSCKAKNIRPLIAATKKNILEDALTKRAVIDYSPFLTKESIGYLPQEDVKIEGKMKSIFVDLRTAFEYSAEDFASGIAPKPQGYILYGNRRDSNDDVISEVFFMKKGSPFVTSSNVTLCVENSGEVVESTSPILRLTHSPDFLCIDKSCYFFSPGIEKHVGLTDRRFSITSKRLDLIIDANIVNDLDLFEEIAFKKATCFLDFDMETFEYIKNLSQSDREDYLMKYGVNTDSLGNIDTADKENCEYLIDLICGRSCLDPLGRLSTAKDIQPRM